MTKEKNPFTLPDGSPDPKHVVEFFEWCAKEREIKLAKMSKEEREEYLKAEQHLNDKMRY